MNEDTLLAMLHKWAILAPENRSLHDIGIVKMVYNHAVSTTQSPFAGIGTHLSVFSELWDELRVYTKVPGTSSYEEKTYFLQRKLELLPEETDTIRNFKKEWADIIAFISCKYGNVLGSTKGREILLFNRKTEELGNFQSSIIAVNNDPALRESKYAVDNYFAKKDLSDEDVRRLVTKLEEVEKNGGNQLQTIATYGKYMAAYDSIYN
jgi:hypothetical protein